VGVAGGADLLSGFLQRGVCGLPDPVDFHAYMTTDLYKHDNMFYLQGANKRVEQPAMRTIWGIR
jgi:hypothetical protein